LQIRGPEDVILECRPAEISQLLINLISNSIEALENSIEKKILIAWSYLGDNLVLSVSDTGPGVPENLRECLMRPFFTTKAVGQSAGLGLSISKKICESHGGTLEFQAQSQQTEFVITLPLVQPTLGETSN
jgi:signal transduction histidine kinase